jgi:hypothetical protein
MIRHPFRNAVILALGLVGGEFLDATGGSEPFVGQANAQGKNRDEIKVLLRQNRMISDKPLTVSLRKDLTPHLRSQIAEAIKRYPDATVRLTLGGVIPPAQRKSIHGFRVFLNKPDATAATPDDDPHYVRSIEFEPTTDSDPQAFAFDILKTLVALEKSKKLDIMDSNQPFDVTIVANPALASRGFRTTLRSRFTN